MRNILIDPVLFTVPENATPQEQIHYLQGLELLREAYLEMSDSTWHFSGNIADLLRVKEAFPDFHLLQRVLNACNAEAMHIDVDIRQLHIWMDKLFIDEFDRKTAMTNQDLQPQLASHGLSEADVQEENTTFQPAEFAQRWDESIQPAMQHLFARLCAYAYLDSEFVADLQIATQRLTDATKRDVDVATMMEYLPMASEGLLAKAITQTFSLLVSPDDLLLLLDNADESDAATSAGAWKWDRTEVGLRAAIDKTCAVRYGDLLGKAYGESQLQKLPLRYTFGSHFIEDLKAISDSTIYVPKKVVEAAAAVIADQVYDTAHFHAKALRKSKGGGIPGRHRGNDKAWRVYVTVRHGGWRLNYWQGPAKDGQERIEFSVIQKKEEQEKIYYD